MAARGSAALRRRCLRGRCILRLLADFEDGATRTVDRDGEEREVVVSRVYPTTHFGFRKITAERPLRLHFQASPKRIAPALTSRMT